MLFRAARFTSGYVRLVGQQPASSKCVLTSTSKVARKDMRDWLLTDEGDRWTVKLDDRDLGGLLDTTFRGWLLLWLRGFGWSVPGWSLFLSFILIFMGGFGLCCPSSSRVLCMGSRLFSC